MNHTFVCLFFRGWDTYYFLHDHEKTQVSSRFNTLSSSVPLRYKRLPNGFIKCMASNITTLYSSLSQFRSNSRGGDLERYTTSGTGKVEVVPVKLGGDT